jgi:hypothetical protein
MHLPKRAFLFSGIIFISLLVFMVSCMDDRYDFSKISDEMEINPVISAPIAYGSVSIADVLDKSNGEDFIREFDDKLLYLCYSDELISLRASEVIDIPDQNFLEFYLDSEFEFPFGSPVGFELSLQKTQNGVFIFNNNEKIDSIFLKNTILRINVSSTFKHSGTLIIQSPNIIINEAPFNQTVVISDITGNFNETIDIPLNGSKIVLENTNPDTTFLPLEFELELVSSGAGISSGDKCIISMSLINLDFNSVYGYFGDYELLYESGGIGINLYGDEIEGDISFYDPQVHIGINNSYGIPVSVQLDDVIAKSQINNTSRELSFIGINPFLINYPSVPGENVHTDIVIDRSTSNLGEILEIQPNEFSFKVAAVTNPTGAGTGNNFVTDSSMIDADVKVVLPLWLKVDGYTITDTVSFDVEAELGEFYDMVTYLRINLAAENGLPVDAAIQVVFTDENYAVLDSMFEESKFLLSATLDANDVVTEKTNIDKVIEFTEDRLESIRTAKQAIVKMNFSTANANENRYVKFFSDYRFDYKLRLRTNLTLNTRDL